MCLVTPPFFQKFLLVSTIEEIEIAMTINLSVNDTDFCEDLFWSKSYKSLLVPNETVRSSKKKHSRKIATEIIKQNSKIEAGNKNHLQ